MRLSFWKLRGVFSGMGVLAACGCVAMVSGCASPGLQGDTVYEWRTLVGQPGGLGNVDGAGEAARFCQPHGVAIDGAGNVYVADYYNYAIRKIAPDGRVTTLAGCMGEPGSTDGTGNAARFDKPQGVAVDASGNVYVSDSGNHTIRKVTADGAVTTFAGRPGEQGHADGAGREARFRSPSGVAVDGGGNVYVADSYNHVIRKINASGSVSTLAGKVELKGGVTVGGFAEGKGAAAKFRTPRGVAVDGAGNVYVADTENAVIRKILPDGSVKTLAGSAGSVGYANGTGTVVRFSAPQSVAVDASGNLYVTDAGNQVVRKITQAGLASTVTNGLARFPSPRGIAVDRQGNLLVSDNDAQVISRIAVRGGVSVVAGCPSHHGSADGKGDAVRFNRPCGIVSDGQRLIVSDSFSQTLRTVSPDGVVTAWVGRSSATGGTDGTGTNATFFWPAGMARDGAGSVLVADSGNHTIRRVSQDGKAVTLAGSAGSSGYADGAGDKARFSWPADVAADRFGTCFVADRANHVIRKVAVNGETSTFAGSAGKAGRTDGAGGVARFNNPSGVAVDSVGNVYVADTGNQTLRKVMPGGEVTTLAGCAGMKGWSDGLGAQARFNGPSDLELDRAGNLYVTDRDNHMIRKVTPGGCVTTLGGQPNQMTCSDGFGTASRFAQPSGIWLDDAGTLYVADACNNRIAVGEPRVEERRVIVSPPVKTTSSAAKAPAAPMATEAYAWDVFVGQPGVSGIDDGNGNAARLSGPQGLALGPDGSLVVADGRAGALRKVSPEGTVTTVVSKHELLTSPIGVGVDSRGVCTVSDGSQALLVVTPRGEVRPLAGAAKKRGAADGAGQTARFDFVPGVCVDAAGSVFVADYNNHTVRRVTPDGTVTTMVGRAGQPGSVDGKGGAARLSRPVAIVTDKAGDLFVATENKIRRVTRQGDVTTVAAEITLGRLDGLAVDSGGNLYAADREQHVIWKVTSKGAVSKLGGSEQVMGGSGWLVTGLAVDRAGNIYVSDATRSCVMRGTPVHK
jgi:sugar lactone lactonase YvrE